MDQSWLGKGVGTKQPRSAMTCLGSLQRNPNGHAHVMRRQLRVFSHEASLNIISVLREPTYGRLSEADVQVWAGLATVNGGGDQETRVRRVSRPRVSLSARHAAARPRGRVAQNRF